MDHRHLWLRSKRQHAILRVRHAIIKAVRDFFDGRDFTLVDAPIFTPNACEGTSTLFETDYHGEQGVPDAVRAALHGGGRRRVRQGLLLRPDVPRREEQDAAAPGRVLDGRAGGRVHGPRGRHAPRRGLPRRSSSGACSRRGARSSRSLERDTTFLETREGAVPAHHVRRGDRAPPGERPPRGEGRRRLRRRRGDGHLAQVRPPGHRPPLPDGAEGVLLQARRRRIPSSRSTWTCSRPRGTARSSAAGSARTTSASSRPRSTQHKLPRDAFEWYLDVRRYGTFPHAGFGLGHRADRRVDLRAAARAGDDPVPAHAQPAIPVEILTGSREAGKIQLPFPASRFLFKVSVFGDA